MAKLHHTVDDLVLDVLWARTWQLMPLRAVFQTMADYTTMFWERCSQWYAMMSATKGSL